MRCGSAGSPWGPSIGGDRTTCRCNQSNQDRHGCSSYAVDAPVPDRGVWGTGEELLTGPAIIAAKLDRRRQQGPATGDLAAVERGQGEIARKQGNLIRRLADLKDDGLAVLVYAEFASRSEQANPLEAERGALARTREGRLLAQGRLTALETWCRNVAANLGELTYEQIRLALQAPRVEVRVWWTDHNPR